MAKKKRIALVFGGKSAEHEVSLQSAKNVYEALDKDKYDVVLVGIDKKGHWTLGDVSEFLLNATDPKLISLNTSEKDVAIVPDKHGDGTLMVSGSSSPSLEQVDVVFPILHGPYGEDGTIQGMLQLFDLAYVGPGVLGSAVAMDKDVAKRLLRDASVPIADFVVFRTRDDYSFEGVEKKLGVPFFVKPANLGSSVGVSKVKNKDEFETAIQTAFEFDTKVLVEEYVKGREIEFSVLGNEDAQVSVPGEIVPNHEFYSYDAKYIDENGAALVVPAEIEKDTIASMQEAALKAYKVLECEGMARVDFFLKDDNTYILNEINTIPGFTKISMYPRLWEASGLSYPKLIDRLVDLAIERHDRRKKLKTSK